MSKKRRVNECPMCEKVPCRCAGGGGGDEEKSKKDNDGSESKRNLNPEGDLLILDSSLNSLLNGNASVPGADWAPNLKPEETVNTDMPDVKPQETETDSTDKPDAVKPKETANADEPDNASKNQLPRCTIFSTANQGTLKPPAPSNHLKKDEDNIANSPMAMGMKLGSMDE